MNVDKSRSTFLGYRSPLDMPNKIKKEKVSLIRSFMDMFTDRNRIFTSPIAHIFIMLARMTIVKIWRKGLGLLGINFHSPSFYLSFRISDVTKDNWEY